MSPNKEQIEAINHEFGPLLVIAGAGTGKTKIITDRIKHLIQDKNVNAQEIVALTFTEKAAGEMSDRVGDVMPLGYEEPWIYTFHQFCDRILKREGIEIGIDPSYKILSGPDQWLFLRRHIFKMDLKYFRPMGSPFKFISAILKFISRLQDENITYVELEDFAKGNYETEEEKERWKELAYIYKYYQDQKIQKSKMDFGDLISWTIKLFEQRPNIKNKYKNLFKHILLDEFQDTNYAQYHLIKLLFESDEKERSLMVVGDDSQSIYKFRGAAISNILQFKKDFPSANMITLSKNYRSVQKILDSSYELIQNNNPDSLESQLGISKKLVSENKEYKKADGEIKIFEISSLDYEADFVVDKILEILGKEPSYTYKDVAILARANSHLDPFILSLRKKGVPYQIVGNRGLYDQPEIRDVIALLKIIVNPKDDTSFYITLNIDSFKIPAQSISKILSESKWGRTSIINILENQSFKETDELISLIKKYQDKITKETVVSIIYSLINESGYIADLTKFESIESHLALKNLDLFLNIAKRFETEFRDDTKTTPNLVQFLDYLEMMIEAGDNPAQAEIEDNETVNLLTVHASKGLEFPVVFMVNLVSGRFPSMNRSDVIEIPDDLINEILPKGDPHILEERRLFYVGMTRAEKYLYMVYSKDYGGKKEKKPSGFLDETKVLVEVVDDEDIKKDLVQDTLFGYTSGFRDVKNMKIYHKPKKLSFTQIDTYTTCPLKYKYKYVLNVPTVAGHALSFGSTIHATLRDFHMTAMHKKVSKDDLYSIYEKNWEGLGYSDDDHRDLQYKYGLGILENYFNEYEKDPKEPMFLEKDFVVEINGFLFGGKIDRVDDLGDGTVELIDYKTGTTKDQKDVDKDLQLALYAVGAENGLNLKPSKLTYYYLESGEKKSTVRNDLQIAEIKKDVREVWDGIQDGVFDPKPSKLCEWCDFKNICPHAYKG